DIQKKHAKSRMLSAALPAIRGGLAALFSTLMEFRFAGETHWARCLAERGLALPMADDVGLLMGQQKGGGPRLLERQLCAP
ncbi:hypothetical protein ACLBSJ_33265, partial [Klebsiella pneumoniae]|uniref:hypothetical protein n=1 Tax=Klebsiella pneumoniae TaxID=573 RepID=UPI003969027B